MAGADGVTRATGHGREEWFTRLDNWGAAGRPYREIADWLTGEQGLSDWWAQKLIVEYEQARGLREPGVRRDGTFEVGASKTIAAPLETVQGAFRDASVRDRWLPGVDMRERASQTARADTFDWADDRSRIVVTISAGVAGKSQVVLEHVRLRDAEAAASMKAYWREHLSALKALLER